ncbi:hypothetical protein VT84_10350 [Gemmata sp. SH-PL17]|uniref:hypothetical protein n=1 Tax=Gemmata sp. SH-PL17 TaxID=1630693 RepID=UPI0004BB9695|nr:hypothetical protein [Gemmata sp. SH-PL17]AMV24787.1 hypothetical protein VT84_10350 [Gemmata sp. SH-PL17]
MQIALGKASGAALLRVGRELVRCTPDNLAEIHCDVYLEQAESGLGVTCHITCPQCPQASVLRPRELLRRAVLDLVSTFEHNGTRITGLRLISLVGTDKKITTSVAPLEPSGASAA